MKKSKIILSLVTLLLVTALLLAGCGKTTAPTTAPPTTTKPPVTTAAPATTAPPTTVAPTTAPPATTRPAATTTSPATTAAAPSPTVPANMAKVTLKKLDGSTMEKLVAKPRYGGTLTYVISDPLWFDDYFGTPGGQAEPMVLTNQKLTYYDWSLGQAGTGERSLLLGFGQGLVDDLRPTHGGLSDGFEFLDPNTVIFHIRKGVRWALNPKSPAAVLVNGREMTSDDLVFTIKRHWTSPYTWAGRDYKDHVILDEVKAIDRYTVQVKWRPGTIGVSWYQINTAMSIVPREAVEKFGDLNDWKNSVGTGPFILTDFVKANSATLVRNPNFWQKDPIFPENQLPYLDGVNLLVIVDPSTQQAALLTAKVDLLRPLTIDFYRSVTKTTSQLKSAEIPGAPITVKMRVDKPEQPWYDKRVRHALSMAVDRETIKNVLYSGYAKIIDVPVYDIPEFSDLYTPISSMPVGIRELYEYHPDKAKQLLAEAGYPNGFTAEVLISSNSTSMDLLQVVQNYWGKIGIDMRIDVKDPGTVTMMTFRATFTQMVSGSVSLSLPYMMGDFRKARWGNNSQVNDPKIEEAGVAIDSAWPDSVKRAALLKPLTPYIYDQRWWTTIVAPSQFAVWWPWLANYHGEGSESMTSTGYWSKYLWIDQDLKKSLGK